MGKDVGIERDVPLCRVDRNLVVTGKSALRCGRGAIGSWWSGWPPLLGSGGEGIRKRFWGEIGVKEAARIFAEVRAAPHVF